MYNRGNAQRKVVGDAVYETSVNDVIGNGIDIVLRYLFHLKIKIGNLGVVHFDLQRRADRHAGNYEVVPRRIVPW